jgi:thioredoxin 1
MATFADLIAEDKPILIDFFAEWCGPCKMMTPELEILAKELKDNVKIVKINVDKNQELAQNLGVRGVPTLMLYRNGKLLWREAGMRNAAQLKQVIEKFNP